MRMRTEEKEVDEDLMLAASDTPEVVIAPHPLRAPYLALALSRGLPTYNERGSYP